MESTSSAVLPQARVDWHLANWERWQRYSRSPGRLPNRASGGMSGYRNSDNHDRDEYDEADRIAAAAVDAVLCGLPAKLKLSVHLKFGIAEPEAYLSLFRSRSEQTEAYAQACAILARELPKRAQC